MTADDWTDAFDDLIDLYDAAHIDGPQYLTEYERAGKRGVRQALLLEYRCVNKRACLLAQAWLSTGRVLYYRPAYKISRVRNEAESVAEARQKNTLDGDRHWRARAGNLAALADWPHGSVGVDLRCDHVERVVTPQLMLTDVQRATPGDPTRRLVAGSDLNRLVDSW